MQQGGSQYGAPPIDMTSQFTSGGSAAVGRTQLLRNSAGTDQLQQQQQQQQVAPLAEAASPISSRPPPPQQTAGPNFEELVSEGVPGGGLGDEDALAAAAGEAERGGAPGNRWPRQETLALLKIRSDMDAAFRDATLKGPLWEDVSRKLAELGYNRSSKKCKEKFENVHKYYKRTKEGRAGRQDGKSYRFFSQLEALHSGVAALSPVSMASPSPIGPAGPSSRAPPQAATPISAIIPPPLTDPPAMARMPTGHFAGSGISSSAAGIIFSSNTSSSSSEDSDDETEEGVGGAQETSRKRKRSEGGSSGGSSCRKMMPFFEGLMKQVMERQEQMQQKFLETIEKREQDRMIREEAWRRQEMNRLAREHEIMAQERAMAANRDAAIIAFLQKVTGQTIQLPSLPIITPPPPQPSPQPPPPTPQQQRKPPPPQPTPSAAPQDPQVQQTPQQQRSVAASTSSADLVPLLEPQEISPASGLYEGVASSSRWPKSEIHDLIELRSGLDTKYQEAGPKGPLWEEISAEMKKLGYNRSAKRCKEKWENINKYFKKVKESNKKRPEDAKTCPYFHQLDALYRKKNLISATSAASGGGSSSSSKEQQETPKPKEPATAAPPQSQPPPTNAEGGKNGGNEVQIPTSNGGLPPSFFEEGNSSKKPEDIMKEMMNRQQQQQHQALMDDYDKLDEGDSDNIDQEYDEDDDEDEEDRKLQYKIQFQRRNGGGNSATASSSNPSGKPATTSAGSFLAMVQ